MCFNMAPQNTFYKKSILWSTIDRIVSCPRVLPDRDRRSFMGLVRPFARLYRAGWSSLPGAKNKKPWVFRPGSL